MTENCLFANLLLVVYSGAKECAEVINLDQAEQTIREAGLGVTDHADRQMIIQAIKKGWVNSRGSFNTGGGAWIGLHFHDPNAKRTSDQRAVPKEFHKRWQGETDNPEGLPVIGLSEVLQTKCPTCKSEAPPVILYVGVSEEVCKGRGLATPWVPHQFALCCDIPRLYN